MLMAGYPHLWPHLLACEFSIPGSRTHYVLYTRGHAWSQILSSFCLATPAPPWAPASLLGWNLMGQCQLWEEKTVPSGVWKQRNVAFLPRVRGNHLQKVVWLTTARLPIPLYTWLLSFAFVLRKVLSKLIPQMHRNLSCQIHFSNQW